VIAQVLCDEVSGARLRLVVLVSSAYRKLLVCFRAITILKANTKAIKQKIAFSFSFPLDGFFIAET
jgi:hypothetical protein